ncbi:MAG: HDIG domain-containing protein [Thermodesulfovibrionia bacterium]|nr:HDIG domain-containing protein [Thermodesulfovibrionia bacterium]
MPGRKNNTSKDKKAQRVNQATLIKISLLIVFTAMINFSLLWRKALSMEAAAGTFFIIALLLIILYKDLMRYKPDFYKNYPMMLLIGILLTGNFIIGGVFSYILEGLHLRFGIVDAQFAIYAIPLATGAMLTALLIDVHTAIVFSVITSLLAGVWLNNPFFSIFHFAASLTGALGVIRCKKRSAIWRAGLFVGLVSVCTCLIIILIQEQILSIETPLALSFAFLNGLIVATLVSAILPLLEHIFNLTTDISLLELIDLNQPLMRNLLVEAPGTYHHSIIVGNLVESAAEAVGVNPLLARVSAYYHDIGKIKMPEYFIENQQISTSRHDKLAPRMSSLILMSHVKEGVEFAKQNKLPDSIIDIIQQHHGTSVITYFFQKAKEQHVDTSTPIKEADFRYSGPKPQSRVAALVLIADAVEAASRALTDPTPSRISAVVERVINHFFLDGQLDDCELTLKDLTEIKSHFVYLLTSVFHRRVSYPGFEIKDDNTDTKSAELQTGEQDKDKKSSPYNSFPVKTP